METIAQVTIMLTGMSMITFFSCKGDRMMKWGFIASLAGQPFWYYTLITHRQWGAFVLTNVYIIMSIRGLINHWRTRNG